MKNKHRVGLRVLALFLSIFFLFAACKGKQEGEENTPSQGNQPQSGVTDLSDKSIILPYFEQDHLNPYFAVSRENRSLASLFAEPLYRVKSDYSPHAVLAASGTANGNKFTVELADRTFSDGSKLTAADVVYSFHKAKASAWYAGRLAKVESASANGKRVVFTFTEPNIFAENVLTFPIVKNKTAEDAAVVPMGTGIYILYSDGRLEKNDKNAASAGAQKVALQKIKDPAHVKDALEIGNLSFLFSDFSNGVYERIVAQNTFVTLNNLVYLGINTQSAPLNSAALRTALYYATNKNGVAQSAYQGCAEPVGLPIHPSVSKALDIHAPSTDSNLQKALEILGKLGYNRFDKQGMLTNGTYALKFSILVNAENPFRVAAAKHIAESMQKIGLSVTVESVPFETYTQRIAAGEFTLYLGEVKLSEDLDLAPFFTAGGSAAAGMNLELPAAVAAGAWHRGEITVEKFTEAFLDDMPFVPICYRAGMAAYEKTLHPDFSVAAYDIYGDIAGWTLQKVEAEK